MADAMNQHKRMAMGQKVTGMKKGGKVKAMRMAKMAVEAPMTAPATLPPAGGALMQAAGMPAMRKGGKVGKKC